MLSSGSPHQDRDLEGPWSPANRLDAQRPFCGVRESEVWEYVLRVLRQRVRRVTGRRWTTVNLNRVAREMTRMLWHGGLGVFGCAPQAAAKGPREPEDTLKDSHTLAAWLTWRDPKDK